MNQKPFSRAFAFESYLTLYLCVNGVAISEVTDSLTLTRTHTHTDNLSTVILAAHARRGLIMAATSLVATFRRSLLAVVQVI